MPVPQVYRKSGEGAIASYNYTDVADGTGVIVFYAIISQTSGSVDYHLVTDSSLYSDAVDIGGDVDLDFDLTAFNLPRKVKGTAYVSIGLEAVGAGNTIYATVQLRHVRGGTETNITSAIASHTLTNEANMMFIPLPITATHFKKDDILRLNVTTTTSGTAGFGVDPANRASATYANLDSRQLKVLVPFQLDL